MENEYEIEIANDLRQNQLEEDRENAELAYLEYLDSEDYDQ